MMTQVNTLRKRSSYALSVCIMLISFSAMPTQAQSPTEEDDELRTTSCWADGKSACKKKRTGTECPKAIECPPSNAVILAF